MKRRTLMALAAVLLIVVPQFFIESPIYARVVSIAGVCLVLWISEIVPPFVPTLILWALIPIVLARHGDQFTLPRVLSWAADPVMALFFGGFVLGLATERSGLGTRIAQFALRSAGNSFQTFLFLVIFLTAVLSMWMSNIAAAALVIACLHPVLERFEKDHVLRRVLLVGIALGADFGGIATPIGSGPNAIAIASISGAHSITFLDWMVFALPLTIGMLGASFIYLRWRISDNENLWKDRNYQLDASVSIDGKTKLERIGFLVILFSTILLWLTESIHDIPAAVVALGSAALLFLSGILTRKDLLRIDWSTLLLIAGGITLGRLLEQSGLMSNLAASAPLAGFDSTVVMFLLCLTSAVLSALMSNTATAVMLIPIASALIPSPSTAIVVAVSASFGIPFVISTPPNAMVYGEGGVRFGDLFQPGIVLMVLGCFIVSLTGRTVLNFVGIP